jgi:pSer/pThr/pTyr-binding forkhead associated (FHA) protein
VDISAPLPQALNLIVTTDPSLVEEPDPATPCPVGAPDRLFPLDLAENLVGRRSERKGIYPEVEISDPGVSHRHLKLIRESDGSFVALELGSANGTRLNGAPMIPGVPLPVKAGDEFVLGIWTRLTLRARG